MQRKILFHLCCCLLLVLVGQRSYGQTGEENALWSRFKSDIRMEQQANNGCIVWDAETKETFLLLLTNSSIETLLKYTNDSLPAVRAKMFYGLCLKGASTEVLQQVLSNHANDTATFISRGGCLVMDQTVRSTMRLYFEFPKKQTLADFKASLESNKSIPGIPITGARHGLIAKEDLLKAIPFTHSERGIKILSFTLTAALPAWGKNHSKRQHFYPGMERIYSELGIGNTPFHRRHPRRTA